MKSILLTGALLGMCATVTFAQTSSTPATQSADTRLEQQARQASTAAEHAEVAKQFRLRADSLETELAALDTEIKAEKSRPQPGIAHKWPAMNPTKGDRLRKTSMDLRRAIAEARRTADKHVALAVEKGFAAGALAQ